MFNLSEEEEEEEEEEEPHELRLACSCHLLRRRLSFFSLQHRIKERYKKQTSKHKEENQSWRYFSYQLDKKEKGQQQTIIVVRPSVRPGKKRRKITAGALFFYKYY